MLGLVPALGLGALYVGADRRAERNLAVAAPVRPTDAPAPSAALLSLRRTPETLATDAERQLFRFALTPVSAAAGSDACLAVERDGTTVFDVGDDGTVIPASNLKLVTAAVALEVLGPDHRFVTSVKGVRNGSTIEGDLYFVGGGDGTLATDDYSSYPAVADYPQEPHTSLDQLAQEIVDLGVTRISGRIVGDDSRYDEVRFVDAWQESIAREEAGPLSALMVNDGFASPKDALPATDPVITATTHLAELLAARGVTIGGGVAAATAPPDAPPLADVSTTLTTLIHEMLATSDDNTAELLLKEIGLARGGVGSTAAGTAAVTAVLAEWGTPLDGIVIADGSGLSNQNRVRCSTILTILERTGPSGPIYDGLPVAGVSGTLASQFLGSPVVGVLRAKTGTLTGAKSLSGFIEIGDDPAAFSLIINGADAKNAAIAAWARLATAFATPLRGPDAAQLGPDA